MSAFTRLHSLIATLLSHHRRQPNRHSSHGHFRPRLEWLEERLVPATYTVDLTTDDNVAFAITKGQLDMGGRRNLINGGDLRFRPEPPQAKALAVDVLPHNPRRSENSLSRKSAGAQVGK